MNRILIAGIGNIFLGDDAFGCEAACALARLPLPPHVTVRDFGIRCLDLAYDLDADWSSVLVLDAIHRGEAPGTLYRIAFDDAPALPADLDPHSVSVEQVRSLALRMGATLPPMTLIGCEPLSLDPVLDGRPALSPPVAAAMAAAVASLSSQFKEVLIP